MFSSGQAELRVRQPVPTQGEGRRNDCRRQEANPELSG
jgi:hypothetical protein